MKFLTLPLFIILMFSSLVQFQFIWTSKDSFCSSIPIIVSTNFIIALACKIWSPWWLIAKNNSNFRFNIFFHGKLLAPQIALADIKSCFYCFTNFLNHQRHNSIEHVIEKSNPSTNNVNSCAMRQCNSTNIERMHNI